METIQYNVDFGETKQAKLCSFVLGTCKHIWEPKLILTKCPGCQGFVLASKMENCPYCNEPGKEMVLRTDCMSRGGGIAKRCLGETGNGETLNIVVERQNHIVAMEQHKFFEDKGEILSKG